MSEHDPGADQTGDGPIGAQTSAQRWSDKARLVIEQNGREAFDSMLTSDFVQESHRGERFEFDRAAMLGLYDTMKELDFHVDGVDVAIAGDLHLLTRRAYISPSSTTELLAVSAWTAGGRLQRLVEFDVGDLDEARAELERLAGVPAIDVDTGG